MAIVEFLTGWASGVLFAVVIPLFVYGHKAVDEKRLSCEQKLAQVIISIAPKVAQQKTVEEQDKNKIYEILDVYALSEYYFGSTCKLGIGASVLLYSAGAAELLSAYLAGVPLSSILGLVGALTFFFFVISLWQMMTTLRRPV